MEIIKIVMLLIVMYGDNENVNAVGSVYGDNEYVYTVGSDVWR